MIKALEYYLMCSDEGRAVRKRRRLKGSRWKGEGGPLSGTERLWHGNRHTQACFPGPWVWGTAWTGLFFGGDKMTTTTQTTQTWRRGRHTTGEIFNSALWECEENEPPLVPRGTCFGWRLPARWRSAWAHSPVGRLQQTDTQTSPRSSAEYGPLFAAKVPPPPAPPLPPPHPSSSASRGRNRRRAKRSQNASKPVMPPGTPSIPTVAIFSDVYVSDLLGLSLEVWISRKFGFRFSPVPYYFLGVFISAEHLVYRHRFLQWPISCKNHGQWTTQFVKIALCVATPSFVFIPLMTVFQIWKVQESR